MSIPRNEATASRRIAHFDLKDGIGNPYSGSLTSPTIQIIKPGNTSWVGANASTLISLTGGPAGTVGVQFSQAETDTAGTLRIRISVGTAMDVDDTVEIDEIENNQATILSDLTTALSDFATELTTLTTVAAGIVDIQARIPAALVGGFLKAKVMAMDTDTLDANALKTDAVTEIQTGLASSTSLATAQTAITNIQARLPAALDGGGNMKAAVQSIVADAINAAAIATNALANAKFADGAITAAKIADGAITAAKIAADAIAGAKLAADAVTKIAAGVLAATVDGVRTVKGVLARANAMAIGKAENLLSSTPRFFLQDGSTKAIEATQDTGAGTRQAASTVNGD